MKASKTSLAVFWLIAVLSAISLGLGIAFGVFSFVQAALMGSIFFLSIANILRTAIEKREGATPAEWIHKFKGPLTVEFVCGAAKSPDWGTDDWAKVTCPDCYRLRNAADTRQI